MPVAAPAYACQVTWRDHGLHVWGSDGERVAPSGWLVRTVRPDAGAFQLTRLAIGAGSRRLDVSAIRVDVPAGLSWLGSHLGGGAAASDSAIWFGQVGVLATRLVATGRVLPRVLDTGNGRRRARWAPVLAGLDETIEVLHDAAPPICHGGNLDTTRTVLGRIVDALCRQQLQAAGWRPAGGQRDPAARARTALLRALSTDDSTIGAAPGDEVRRIASTLDRARRRSDGEPVVVPRLRLDPPDDPLGPWSIQLQLVDDGDAGRWCNAADVWAQTPLAVDLAGEPRNLRVLETAVGEAAAMLSAELEPFADWNGDDTPAAVELDVAGVHRFLQAAPNRLDRLDIGLIGPERLVRATPRVHGTVRDDGDGRAATSGRLGHEAVVDWTMIVEADGRRHPLDEAALARATEAGASLLYSGGRWVRLDADELRAAASRLHALRITHRRVRPVQLLALAADAANAAGEGAAPDVAVHLDAEAHWAAALLSGLGDALLSEATEPQGFCGTLRPYQRRGLAWLGLLADVGLGGCLADDMGLGKTATTLAHLATRPGPHLVVCPLSVVRNWQRECAQFVPALRARIHHGSDRAVHGQVALFADDDDIVITTYGILARDLAALAGTEWSTVVLDEAQAVKNSSTLAARAVRSLRAGQKLALTGTPVENRLADLWSILDAVNPGLLGSKRAFRDRFATPIERDHDAAAAARLRTLTQPLVLRRTKADRSLLPDLPDKIEQVAWASLSHEQSVLYREVVNQLLADAATQQGMRRRGIVLAAITRLKQICNHPAHALGDGSRLAGRSGKLERFDELLAEILDTGAQILVFTQFRAMGALLQQHMCATLRRTVPFLEGSVPGPRRVAMVDRFQEGIDPVLLVSLRAGGTGLNLTAASHVVHFDRWWNPAVEDQASDRAWRIGQRRSVVVHKLVTTGTVEERIAEVIDAKRAVADAAIGTGEAWISELSTDELAALVRLDWRQP